ncbi:unnamed protein product [Adineta ricciae]|uniref:Uncharacterized protein n=1 Tax=Adineta ricciae TaxID=249248 RepID=A0A813PZK5_ADIRI|nr:unnamed protein product [Adineta ricciae]
MVHVPPSIVNLFPGNTIHKNVKDEYQSQVEQSHTRIQFRILSDPTGNRRSRIPSNPKHGFFAQRIHDKRTNSVVDYVSNINSEHDSDHQTIVSTSTSSIHSNQLIDCSLQAMSVTTSPFQSNQLTAEIVQPSLATASVFQNNLSTFEPFISTSSTFRVNDYDCAQPYTAQQIISTVPSQEFPLVSGYGNQQNNPISQCDSNYNQYGTQESNGPTQQYSGDRILSSDLKGFIRNQQDPAITDSRIRLPVPSVGFRVLSRGFQRGNYEYPAAHVFPNHQSQENSYSATSTLNDQYNKLMSPTDKMIIELLLAYKSGLATTEESFAKIKSLVGKDNATSQ